MNGNDCKKMEKIAELVVRRFFQHYLEKVFPEQLIQMVAAHNQDVTAHAQQIQGAVKIGTLKIKLWLYGLIFTVGVSGGFGIAKAIASLKGN